jgi:tryptophanyl-tRNA synthetase
MSASNDISAIFMTDSAKQIAKKINKYAFSGGRDTLEEQKKYGGNPDVDVAYQYLSFILEDDEELQKINDDYRAGKLMTGELKAICIKQLQEFVASFQESRAKVTDETVKHFGNVNRQYEWTNQQNFLPKKK